MAKVVITFNMFLKNSIPIGIQRVKNHSPDFTTGINSLRFDFFFKVHNYKEFPVVTCFTVKSLVYAVLQNTIHCFKRTILSIKVRGTLSRRTRFSILSYV